MMQNAQKRIVVKAGDVVAVNLDTFVNVSFM